MLDEWFVRIREELAAPFAANLIVHRTNARLERDLGLCVKYRLPVVITSPGAREEVTQAAHSYGDVRPPVSGCPIT